MSESFFAPSQFDAFDGLINEYDNGAAKLETVHRTLEQEGFLQFVVDSHSRLLSYEQSLSAYRSYMWSRAMQITDVLDFMPTQLRDAWTKLIETGDGRDLTPQLQLESGFIDDVSKPIEFKGIPEFTQESVRATVGTLMRMRSVFLTNMVDGLFFNLSGTHVTNQPEGFGKRFIIDNVYNQDFFGINFHMYSKVDYIHDLRFVIGKLLRRNPIRYGTSRGDSDDVIKSVVDEVGYGKWTWIDGNAIKIRCYKKGTVHIELHPDLTWQLNAILANKHPNAIPAKFTKKPSASSRKERVLIERVVDEHLIKALRRYSVNSANAVTLGHALIDKWRERDLDHLMTLIGGIRLDTGCMYRFDYDPSSTLDIILTNRVIPDQKSHQFYPSPVVVVDEVCKAIADLDDIRTVCEPSCGTGNILIGLSVLNYDVVGYEVNSVFADVASQRLNKAMSNSYGLNDSKVITSDFLDVKDVRYDAIAMNPPFDQGRWLEHVVHATTLTNDVVAVLPEGANCERVGVDFKVLKYIENAFDDTSITVKIVHFSK